MCALVFWESVHFVDLLLLASQWLSLYRTGAHEKLLDMF
jgi:hypothetical protein